MKRCQSCGRLIELLEDFAGLDQSGIYCSSCADDTGKLKTFEEVLDNLTHRIAKTDAFDESASRNAALQILGRQPAWEPKFKREEKVKTNKRKLMLIGMSIVLVLTAGGVTWWLTRKFYSMKELDYYKLHIANYDEPFSDIRTETKEQFTIHEFRCKGDQELIKLEDGLLQFRSCENLGEFPYDKNIVSDQLKDYSSYIINLENMESVNLEKITYKYSKAERDKLEKLVAGERDVIEWQSPSSAINVKYGFPEMRKELRESEKVDVFLNHKLFKPVRYSIKQRNFLENYMEDFYTNMSTNLEYRYKDKTLETFCEFDASLMGLSNYIYIFQNEEYPELKMKFCIGDGIPAIVNTKDNIVVMKIYIRNKKYASDDERNIELLVIDMDKESIVKRDLPFNKPGLENAFDRIVLISNDVLYKIEQKTNGTKVDKYFHYDAINDINTELGIFPTGLEVVSFKQSGTDFEIQFSKENDKNKDHMELMKYSSEDGKLLMYYKGKKLISKNVVGEWVIGYQQTKVKSKYNDVYNKNMLIMELYAVNTETGKATLLCDNYSDSYPSLLTDGIYIAWTKNAGSKDDQWKNVCFTKLPDSK